MTANRFEALSRITLNNWHYINHRVLSFHQGINFFTGHSGSGKSTVIDAMQIVLYANTDGRGFFNKAAADDSDRNLIEYLRGMVNIADNNEFSYLRNQNFSSTIVLELHRTETDFCQCIGVVFDVETGTNEINRLFFWHEGPLFENQYRTQGRAMTIDEVRQHLIQNYNKESCYFGSHNERFRKQLYDSYLGGLDGEKFPLLFKRAIPFRMNIKLEDFVKEYICMEQDIHIEDMQESVMQYGRMQKKIADTREEIAVLAELNKQYEALSEKQLEQEKQTYVCKRLEIEKQKQEISQLRDKITLDENDCVTEKEKQEKLQVAIQELASQSDLLLRQIAESGYDHLKEQLSGTNQLLEQLAISKAHYESTTARLKKWIPLDLTYNTTIDGIELFAKGSITQEQIKKLQRELKELQSEVTEQQQEAKNKLRELQKEEKQADEELGLLRMGDKAYPKELEMARGFLIRRLSQEVGKAVRVEVLADLLEIKDDRWRNAVEGYLGGNKLSLIVEPQYVKMAMEIYGELDPKQYHRVAVLDTEKVESLEHTVSPDSLAEEVSGSRSYVNAYIRFMLGKVIKCQSVDQLHRCKIGVTSDCILYHSFRMQHMNPDSYTKSAYIGKDSARQRMKLLKQQLEQIRTQIKPHQEMIDLCRELLQMEILSSPSEVYMGWQGDMERLREKQREKKKLEDRIEQLRTQNIHQWEEERHALLLLQDGKKREQEQISRQIWDMERRVAQNKEKILTAQEELMRHQDELDTMCKGIKDHLEQWQADSNQPLGRLMESARLAQEKAAEAVQKARDSLVDSRTVYLRQYVSRTTLSPTDPDNSQYEQLLERLSCDHLEQYEKIAAEQAVAAVQHFKDDFIFKIRSAIREALIRKDELNKVISKLDFGKDKYQFVIGRHKGAFGPYYDMFMDESLEVKPMDLHGSLDHQMNMFSMEHENRHGEQMNELIHAFIPPEHATPEQMEQAKQNMERFADYRTYLSFDMQQLIHNEDGVMKIGLGKMIRKNSGGEGQNPLYVALLASFAQAYRISLRPQLQRKPTIRLVVLDEAFSKMDSEKVASCIELIRGLGFQALISATNDKIQNYLENVDKTFVFANPSKKCISVQEFERSEFGELSYGLDEE